MRGTTNGFRRRSVKGRKVCFLCLPHCPASYSRQPLSSPADWPPRFRTRSSCPWTVRRAAAPRRVREALTRPAPRRAVVKTKIQNEPNKYSGGLVQTARLIVDEAGPGALVLGAGPTLVGYALHGGFKYGLYEAFKPEVAVMLYSLRGGEHAIASAGGGPLDVLLVLLAAGLASECFASVVLCPLEVGLPHPTPPTRTGLPPTRPRLPPHIRNLFAPTRRRSCHRSPSRRRRGSAPCATPPTRAYHSATPWPS